MIDKGLTKAALQKVAKLGKKEFSMLDIGANTGMIQRAIDYEVIEKTGYGKYRALVKDPVGVYMAKKNEAMDNHQRGSYKAKAMPVSQRNAEPAVRVTPYHDGEVLIQIGRRMYVATEVAMVPVPRRNNG